jgi:hypothetical protein
LSDIVVLNFVDSKVNEHKTAQDAVVKNQIDTVRGVVDRDAVLSTDEGESLAELQKEGLEMVTEPGLQIFFTQGVRLRDLKKLKHERITQKIRRLGHKLPLFGELENGLFILSSG